jgi:hypothetical protein
MGCWRREQVSMPADRIYARAVRIQKLSDGRVTISRNDDSKDVARVYYSLLKMVNTGGKRKREGKAPLQSVCVFLSRDKSSGLLAAFGFNQKYFVTDLNRDACNNMYLSEDATEIEALFSGFKSDHAGLSGLQPRWPTVVERLRLDDSWKRNDNWQGK